MRAAYLGRAVALAPRAMRNSGEAAVCTDTRANEQFRPLLAGNDAPVGRYSTLAIKPDALRNLDMVLGTISNDPGREARQVGWATESEAAIVRRIAERHRLVGQIASIVPRSSGLWGALKCEDANRYAHDRVERLPIFHGIRSYDPADALVFFGDRVAPADLASRPPALPPGTRPCSPTFARRVCGPASF